MTLQIVMADTAIEQYVALKTKQREIEQALKVLESQIKESLVGKVEVGNYILSKKNRTSYVLKQWIDMDAVKARYPWICETVYWIDPNKLDINIIKESFPEAYYEKITVEAKELYKVAENPTSLVEEKITEYLEVKENKSKEEDIDF